ncbi:MAG: hypothetical protein HQK87_11290 [Nitrospinae bacterium]|nr:hypothetical protein [Nitrospinota bacterium]
MNIHPFQLFLRRTAGPLALLSAMTLFCPSSVRAEDAYILDVLRGPDVNAQVTVSARLYGPFTDDDIRETIASARR